MMLLIKTENDFYLGVIGIVVLLIFLLIVVFMLLKKVFFSVLDGLEITYATFTKRPFFVHFYFFRKKLSTNQINILKREFDFYNRLNTRYQRHFRHRLASFINAKTFEGKDGFLITEEVKVLISATAIMLTFGFRDFMIKSLRHIIVYPTDYFSQINEVRHKGEFNINLKTLVLSWDNFVHGYDIKNDKINLGIHEFAHAIHFNCIHQNDINSIIFVDTFNELRTLFSTNENLKKDIQESKFIRSYALTNDFELLAVILETFIETPNEFKRKLPEIYLKVKQMLNFNFVGY